MDSQPLFLNRHESLRMPGLAFASGFVAIVLISAVVAGMLPIEFSIASVFLFAGPHNWLEARYILGRLPARMGKLRNFFLMSFAGIVGFAGTFALLPMINLEPALTGAVYATWDTAFLFWIATLVWMRSRTNPRFDGGWVWPAAFLLSAVAWLSPAVIGLALVYLHPLMALVLLDRELTRSHREWRPLYRCALGVMPVVVLGLWWQLHERPNLTGDDPLSLAITNHAGAEMLANVSTHFLVALHTFLEMVHYAAWVVLIPLIGMRSAPWELRTIPVARQWPRIVAAFLLLGVLICMILWACFTLDYGTTRSVYFTVALLHVLAEIPFLLRMV